MANMIFLKEQENRLFFDGTYTPVVCANSNYYVHIEFSDEWARCHNKVAVFVIGDRKKQMKFEGNIIRLPAFPNAPFFELLVYAKDDDELFSTTALKIRLEPIVYTSVSIVSLTADEKLLLQQSPEKMQN
ncbi:MAG: hypothetical protein J6J33_05450 [Clostridia bacterium]|nr:hypothetical protein [Clostridia bacterium]